MRLKKLAPLLFILPLSGCPEQDFTPNQALIKRIWQKTIEITGIPRNTPLPVIDFSCAYNPDSDKKFGQYDFATKIIEVYPMEIYSYLFKWRRAHPYESIEGKQGDAFLYSVVAHEMLHYALHVRKEIANQHQLIWDRQYMQPLLSLINNYLNLPNDGAQNDIAIQCLELGIKIDQEKIKPKK